MKRERGNPTEFPLPHDQLLMIDLDKTLIDPTYQVTDHEIFDQITFLVKSKNFKKLK